ncbi:hypothetical protein [Hymenobacter coccineus]|uniref:Uncharacterized protein n=1 Tax=Hymenobacter coccineus TaxID=1908235 RepID=A0A1G1T9I5_9BACT|nr:hypothetical protein [Hymenobacter coccineus]OGX87521.1 hypothetical protein BEN49_10665 [Hymenobacter coccineus]
MSLYHQPSNKMPLSGALLFLVGGAAAAAVLALVYIYAIWYIPFIYINVVLCGGFGLLLGVALARLARAGKLRSPRGVGALAAVVALGAVYLEWGVYLTMLFGTETPTAAADSDVASKVVSSAGLSVASTSFSPSLFATILAEPAHMWNAMRQINETGTWSLKSATPSGLLLWAIWLIEAAIIVGGAYLVAVAQAGEPFSEATDTWADEETLPHPVGYIAQAAEARQAFETGQFHLLTPHVAENELDQFACVRLHRAPNDDACQFLTLENVTVKRDRKGKITQKTANVVQRLAISPAAYQALKTQFGAPPAAGR